MPVQDNPLSKQSARELNLNAHARYVLENRVGDPTLIEGLRNTPKLNFERDPQSGHFVARYRGFIIVWKKNSPHSFTILTVMRDESFQG